MSYGLLLKKSFLWEAFLGYILFKHDGFKTQFWLYGFIYNPITDILLKLKVYHHINFMFVLKACNEWDKIIGTLLEWWVSTTQFNHIWNFYATLENHSWIALLKYLQRAFPTWGGSTYKSYDLLGTKIKWVVMQIDAWSLQNFQYWRGF